MKRRDFVKAAAAGLAAGAAGRGAEAFALERRSQAIRFGYAAITWNGNDRQAIEDVSALGFPGIQLRANVLAAANPRYVRLELDVAHYTQGGGDPVKAIDRYHDRLLFLHLKDVETVPPAPGTDPARSYRFVELGRGRVDLPGVFAALKRVGFKGWAVVELDAVPDKARTPKESGQISKSYLEKQGFRIEEEGGSSLR